MKEGMTVFYLEDGAVYSGRVIDLEPVDGGFFFSIDSYGTCEGQYRIASGQLGKTVFEKEEEAIKAAGLKKQ